MFNVCAAAVRQLKCVKEDRSKIFGDYVGICVCFCVCVYVTMGMREIFERNEMLSFISQFFVSPSRFIPTQQLQTGGDERSLHSSLV